MIHCKLKNYVTMIVQKVLSSYNSAIQWMLDFSWAFHIYKTFFFSLLTYSSIERGVTATSSTLYTILSHTDFFLVYLC